ncbi:hypothetical protein CHS0354_011173 [Potamilus streckersoni]|uniref:Poly [ADP-ribose] polymerase n=1 Tax=Potamilus streckersoni TaxID=2493646 RepID=A0AAE0S128_9BIVA|nr:hypothetical protein CHS0354_011173 [Potamilus streckersoni]
MLNFEAEETMSSHNSRDNNSDSDLDLLVEYDDTVDSTVAEVDFLGHEKLVNQSSKLSSNPATLLLLSDQSIESRCKEKLNVSGEEILTGEEECSSVINVDSSQDSLTDNNDNDIRVIGDDQIALESSYMNACSPNSDNKNSYQKKLKEKIKPPTILFNEKPYSIFPSTLEKKIQDSNILSNKSAKKSVGFLRTKTKDADLQYEEELYTYKDSPEGITYLKKPCESKDDSLLTSLRTYGGSNPLSDDTDFLKSLPGEKEDFLLRYVDKDNDVALVFSESELMKNQNFTAEERKESQLLSAERSTLQSHTQETEDSLPPYGDSDNEVQSTSSLSKQRKNLKEKQIIVPQNFSIEGYSPQSMTKVKEDSLPPYVDNDEVPGPSLKLNQVKFLTIEQQDNSSCERAKTSQFKINPRKRKYPDIDVADSTLRFPVPPKHSKIETDGEDQLNKRFKTGRAIKLPASCWVCDTCQFINRGEYSRIRCSACDACRGSGRKKGITSELQSQGFSREVTKLPVTQRSSLPENVAEYWTCPICTVANKNEVASCLFCDTPKHIPESQATRNDPEPVSPTLTEDDVIHKVQEIFPNVSWFYLVKLVKKMCEKNPDRNAVLLEIVDSFSTNPYPTNPDFNLYQNNNMNTEHSVCQDGVQESNGKGKGKMPIRRFNQKSKSSSSGFVTSSSSSEPEPGPSSSTDEVSSSVSDSDIKNEHGVSSSEATKMRCENCPSMELSTKISECCDQHPLCVSCVEKAAKEALAGKKMGPVMCPKPGCQSSVPKSQLQNVLPNIIMDLLEDKWLQETHDAVEDMEGLVKCPSCNFKVFMDLDVKLFQCPGCTKITCRYCQKDWAGDNHSGCTANQNYSMTTKMETATSGYTFAFPPNWDMTFNMDKSYIKVPLKSDTPEYHHVMAEFQGSGGINHTIRNIYRVQNPRLWQKYSLQKSHMLEDLGQSLLNEKHLYHGTDDDAVEKICKEGFDWRLCGVHGTAFGKGTYFALDAAISCSYSSSRQSSGLFALTRNSVGTFRLAVAGYASAAIIRGSANGNNGNFGASQTSFGNTSSAPSLPGVGVFGPAVTSNAPQSSINSGFTFGIPIQTSLSSGFSFGSPSSSGNSNTGFTFGNSNVPSGFCFGSNSGNSLFGSPFSSTSNLNLPQPAFGFTVGNSLNQNQSIGTNTNNLLQKIPSNPSFGQNCFPSPSGANFLQPSRFMFYAKVLVGQCCRGDSSMKKPPINQNDPQQRPYNSVVDDPNNPKIFVIFDSSQTYPEYLIEFI